VNLFEFVDFEVFSLSRPQGRSAAGFTPWAIKLTGHAHPIFRPIFRFIAAKPPPLEKPAELLAESAIGLALGWGPRLA
jgi:hypothetical protein